MGKQIKRDQQNTCKLWLWLLLKTERSKTGQDTTGMGMCLFSSPNTYFRITIPHTMKKVLRLCKPNNGYEIR